MCTRISELGGDDYRENCAAELRSAESVLCGKQVVTGK
jgi:hypothetical protein